VAPPPPSARLPRHLTRYAMRFGFRVSGFGFRVSGFGFRDQGSGIRVQGGEGEGLGLRFQDWGLRCQYHLCIFCTRYPLIRSHICSSDTILSRPRTRALSPEKLVMTRSPARVEGERLISIRSMCLRESHRQVDRVRVCTRACVCVCACLCVRACEYRREKTRGPPPNADARRACCGAAGNLAPIARPCRLPQMHNIDITKQTNQQQQQQQPSLE